MAKKKQQCARAEAPTSRSAAHPRQGPAETPRSKGPKHHEAHSVRPAVAKVTLPGEIYQRAGRWWWRGTLPGENRPRARALKAPGAKAASRNQDEARKLAVEMWEQAIRQEESRHVTIECAQKVERLKAQFLDKIQSLTQIVQGANAKAEAEARTRAEIEARFNAMIQAGERKISSGMTETPQERRTAPADMHGHAHTRLETPADVASGPCPPASAIESHDRPVQTAVCECCGVENAPADLQRIDSGQRLCPDCLSALRLDISRIDSYDSAESRA